MITSNEYGKLPNGQVAFVYTIKNRHGNKLSLTNYGGRLVSILIKDKSNTYRDLVLGFDDLNGYLNDTNLLGASLGVNVSVQDKFEADVSDLPSFGDILWDARCGGQEGEESVTFRHTHHFDSDKKVDLTLQYSLTQDNKVKIREQISPNCDIVCGLVQQVFFNLNATNTLDGHTAVIDADLVSTTDDGWMPKTQESVSGRINLKTPKTLKNLGAAKHPLIKQVDGIELCYKLNKTNIDDIGLGYAGRVRGRATAIKLEVYTTKPNLYFYTANKFDNILGKKQTSSAESFVQPANNFDNVNTKKSTVYNKHSGFVLNPITDNTALAANQNHKAETVYKFVVR